MNPILVNLAGLIFLMQAESGILVQNFERQTSRTREDVFDASQGVDIGFVSYNPQATYTCKGRVSGGGGVAAASPGVSIAFANLTTGNGVTAGGIYTETVSISHTEKGFREISVTAMQKPGIA
jgi:hypothetical protein